MPKSKLKQPHNCKEHIIYNDNTCTRCEHIIDGSCFCGKYVDDDDYNEEAEYWGY